MKTCETEKATKRANADRPKLPSTKALLLSIRSTKAPIGIAKNNQGSNPKAESKPIKIGSSVSDTANKGADNFNTPSTRLVINEADQIREKSLPKEGCFDTRQE